jgi:hypothetical protein
MSCPVRAYRRERDVLPTPPRKSYRKVWAGLQAELAGRCGSSPCNTYPGLLEVVAMSAQHPTRRQFLVYGSMLVVGVAGSAQVMAQPMQRQQAYRVYRYSCRGRRCSQLAKTYAANKRFATQGAAKRNPPHPGHRARIVSVVVSEAQFVAWFGRGKRQRQVVDLRTV